MSGGVVIESKQLERRQWYRWDRINRSAKWGGFCKIGVYEQFLKIFSRMYVIALQKGLQLNRFDIRVSRFGKGRKSID